jgi:hypothetical protein
LGAFEIPYSKLIGWEIEGREVIRLSSCESLDGEIVSHVAVKTLYCALNLIGLLYLFSCYSIYVPRVAM